MLIGVTVNNRGEKDQSGKTGLELYGCLVWLPLVDELRIESANYDKYRLEETKKLVDLSIRDVS